MSSFGNRLRRIRRKNDITQKQLAEFLGVTSASVGKYETCPNSYPSIEVLIKIADYFNVSIDYLLCGVQPAALNENNINDVMTNRTVLQANRGGTVFIDEQKLSPEEKALLNIYNNLGVRGRIKLLNFVFELEEEP